MPRIAVVGLGRFGTALARELAANGAQVIAIDSRLPLVNEIKDEVDLAVRLDATDESALSSQKIAEVDTLVVAIGENFEAALLTTVIAKRLGVGRIICRAQTKFHAEIFRQIGADEVIQPEGEAGVHLGRRLAHPHINDFIPLAKGYTLIELQAPAEFCDKSLMELGLRAKYGVNLIAIKRAGPGGETEEDQVDEVVSVPKPDTRIVSGDILVLVGSDDALATLPRE